MSKVVYSPLFLENYLDEMMRKEKKMGKFNKSPTISTKLSRRTDLTLNEEGGLAFSPTAKNDLTLRVLTWLVGEPKFYDNSAENDEIDALIAAVAEQDPEYLLQLASYARNEMYLRSAPIYLLVQAAKYDAAKKYIRPYVSMIIKRADELSETLALFIAKNGEIGTQGKASLPNSLKKGLADCFYSFDRYQFAKYDRDGEVKLKDVLRLTHPKPRNDDESETFKMIRDRSLPIPETWETVISTKGSTKESWESIWPKMGYMALLRNLRNLLKVGVNVDKVAKYLTDPAAVKYSKQLPFRFLSAYKVLETESAGDPFARQTLLKAIETALELSIANISKLSGRTYVACDNSGSMNSAISEKSTMTRKEIANLMGVLGFRISDMAVISMFGTSLFVINSVRQGSSLLQNTREMGTINVGGNTNAYLALKYLLDNKISVDRILLFSDMQCYGPENRWGYIDDVNQSLYAQLKKYKQTINPNVYLYSFDLAGYGTLQFPEDEKRVCLLGGFSERVFDFIKAYESFSQGLIDKIERYVPKNMVKKEEEEE